jgi:hypothetical protein
MDVLAPLDKGVLNRVVIVLPQRLGIVPDVAGQISSLSANSRAAHLLDCHQSNTSHQTQHQEQLPEFGMRQQSKASYV